MKCAKDLVGVSYIDVAYGSFEAADFPVKTLKHWPVVMLVDALDYKAHMGVYLVGVCGKRCGIDRG